MPKKLFQDDLVFFHLGIFGWQHHTKLFNLHFKNFGKWYSWKKESDHFKYAEKSFFDFLIKNWESLSFQKFGWNSWKFKKRTPLISFVQINSKKSIHLYKLSHTHTGRNAKKSFSRTTLFFPLTNFLVNIKLVNLNFKIFGKWYS